MKEGQVKDTSGSENRVSDGDELGMEKEKERDRMLSCGWGWRHSWVGNGVGFGVWVRDGVGRIDELGWWRRSGMGDGNGFRFRV